MEFQKNHFLKNSPTKLAGDKVLPKNNPFEISKNFLYKSKNQKIEERPMTPEQRFVEQQNQAHFIDSNSFRK